MRSEAALEWARLPAGASHNYLSRRLRAVRSFARYLHALDPACEVPSIELLRSSKYRPAPYLYSQEEIVALMTAARAKSREVLLHPSAVQALVSYAEIRDRLCPHPSQPSFFLTTRGTRPAHPTIYQPFRALLENARIKDATSQRRVRPHDLRHSLCREHAAWLVSRWW